MEVRSRAALNAALLSACRVCVCVRSYVCVCTCVGLCSCASAKLTENIKKPEKTGGKMEPTVTLSRRTHVFSPDAQTDTQTDRRTDRRLQKKMLIYTTCLPSSSQSEPCSVSSSLPIRTRCQTEETPRSKRRCRTKPLVKKGKIQ